MNSIYIKYPTIGGGGGGGGTAWGTITGTLSDQTDLAAALALLAPLDSPSFTTSISLTGRILFNADQSLGPNASQNFNFSSIACGDTSTAQGKFATAYGYDTNASAVSSIALGGEAQSTVNFGLAVGWGASASSGGFALAVGSGAQSSGAHGIAIGHSASDTGAQDAISIGRSTTNGPGGIAIGFSANAQGGNSVAIGYSSQAAAVSSIAIGESANASDNQCIAIGQNSIAAGSGIAIGIGASSTATNYNLAFGRFAYANSEFATVIGNNFNNDNALSDASAPNGVTLGGMNKAGSPVAENWLGIVPGTVANTPRLLFPAAAVTDDGTSAVQLYGQLALQGATTSAGGATPVTVTGYLTVIINGVSRKIPYI